MLSFSVGSADLKAALHAHADGVSQNRTKNQGLKARNLRFLLECSGI